MKKIGIVLAALFFAFLAAGCEQQAESYHKATAKGRMVEAETNLPAIVAMQAGFKAMNQKFAATFQELNFSLSGNNQNYSYFMGDDVIKGARGPDKLPENLPNQPSTADSFVVYAIANLDDDADLDVWKIDQNGNLQHVRSDL